MYVLFDSDDALVEPTCMCIVLVFVAINYVDCIALWNLHRVFSQCYGSKSVGGYSVDTREASSTRDCSNWSC